MTAQMQEVLFTPGDTRKVPLPDGLPVAMMMKFISGRPALAILAGSHFGLERNFNIFTGGNFVPVSDEDQIHIRAGLDRAATFKVAVSGQRVIIRLAS